MHSLEKHLDRYVKNLIRLNALKLAKACGDSAVSGKDMEQELYIELFNRFGEFQPDKGSFHTFAKHVIKGRASTILHKAYTKKRGKAAGRISIYEEEPCGESDESISLLEKIDAQDAIHIMGGNSLSLTDRVERIKEIRELVKSLPEELRKACACIMGGKTISETVAELGISRSSFYYQAIIPLKKIFSKEISS